MALVAEDAVLGRVIAHANAHADGDATCSFNRSVYRGETRDLPIGVFDSGIGGLTVLEAILALDAFDNETLRPGSDGRRDFECERFVYFGDQANMPYGNYPGRGKAGYLRERILKDAIFLLGTRAWSGDGARTEIPKPPVKAIVIACNTATAYGLEDVRAVIRAWDLPIPVIGIVEAGARGVMGRVPSGKRGDAVAILATVGTCDSKAYPKAIGRAIGLAGKPVPPLIQQGSVGLAGAIEGDPSFICDPRAGPRLAPYQGPAAGNPRAPLHADRMALYGFTAGGILGDAREPSTLQLNSVQDYARYDVATLLEDYRQGGGTAPIGTVVLGCTHFPLIQAEITEAFARLRDLEISGLRPFRALIADQIEFLNPAELIARELFRGLAEARLRLKPGERHAVDRDLFFISVANPSWPGVRLAPDGSLDAEYKYGRNAGRVDADDTRPVPLRGEALPASSLNLIKTRLPKVWERLAADPAPR
ncbi:MAG TPA: aspartate/glutamate racemase family protein [Verrucomicrobiae bacterium]|nr:aspartate/glutamate racemase family protein [Verrucomicrobiae bacterium]